MIAGMVKGMIARTLDSFDRKLEEIDRMIREHRHEEALRLIAEMKSIVQGARKWL